jgi:hypothetical protein
MIHASGEAAELIAASVSAGVMSDIVEVVVVSRNFTNDIEPINEMDASMEVIKSGLGPDFTEACTFNPLYMPQSIDALDDVLEVETKTDNVRFVGMNENPFAIKVTEVTSHQDESIITAITRYQQFDLPSYEVIMEQQQRVLN